MAPGTLPCYSPTQKKKRIIKRINKTDTNREREIKEREKQKGVKARHTVKGMCCWWLLIG
jgi:hypothetical protein